MGSCAVLPLFSTVTAILIFVLLGMAAVIYRQNKIIQQLRGTNRSQKKEISSLRKASRAKPRRGFSDRSTYGK